MSIATLLFYFVAPAAIAAFLLWRAYQMGTGKRVELTCQWIVRPPDGIEGCARLFAWRDLLFAASLLLALGLLLCLPRYAAAWIPLMALGGFVHQCFTGYALARLRKQPPR